MSKSIYRTRGSANIKAKIHDKEECQCQGWDPRQVEGLQMQLKVKIHFAINSPCELCYPIWCWTWPKSHSPGQCIVPGLSQGVQDTFYMYQVWVKESRALLYVPGHSSHSSRCTRSESRSPRHSLYVPGHFLQFKMHQVWVKESRALFTYTRRLFTQLKMYQVWTNSPGHSLSCTRSKLNSPRPMVPVTLVHYNIGNAILSQCR